MPLSDHSAFSPRLPALVSRLPRLPVWAQLSSLLALVAVGCTPHIGDNCTVSTNCSASGDRLCDITQPGGYCTVFNCEPDSCPDDAICVNFGAALSPTSQCSSSQGDSPYERSFCMAACGTDGDCRGGYICQDLDPGSTSNFIGGVASDYSRHSAVCAVKPNATPITQVTYDGGGNSSEVCLGSDAGAPVDTGSGGGPAGGGALGVGGESGASDAGAGG